MRRYLIASLVLHGLLLVWLLFSPNRREPSRLQEKIIPINLVAMALPPPKTIPARENEAATPLRAAEPKVKPDRPTPAAVRRETPPEPEMRPVPDLVAKLEAPLADKSLKEKIAGRLKVSTPAPPPAAATLKTAAPATPEKAAGPQPQKTAASPPAAQIVPPRSAANASLQVQVGGFAYAWYLSLLQNTIFEQWTPPQKMLVLKPGAAAMVVFTLDRRGIIREVALAESSGYTLLDRSALDAVKRVSGLPPLPVEYKEDSLRVVVVFTPLQG